MDEDGWLEAAYEDKYAYDPALEYTYFTEPYEPDDFLPMDEEDE
jgi:hypothetical protein